MASARGAVEVTVAGERRVLRVSLDAIQRFETKEGNPNFVAVVKQWVAEPENVALGIILDLFLEFCLAGGTPLTAEERSDLLLTDMPEISEAIKRVFNSSEVVVPAAGAEGRTEKKRTPARKSSRGGTGRR